MSDVTTREPGATGPVYEKPTLITLGSVVELTLSGNCCDTADKGSYYY
jgi:hypothetical protein